MIEEEIIKITPEMRIGQIVKKVIYAKNNNLFLEVPEECFILNNHINLRMLKIYADEQNKTVNLVTNDENLTVLAGSLGIAFLAPASIPAEQIDQVNNLHDPEVNHNEYYEKSDPNNNYNSSQLIATNPGSEATEGVNLHHHNTSESTVKTLDPHHSLKYPGNFMTAIYIAAFTLIITASAFLWSYLQPKATVIVTPKEKFLKLKVHTQIDPNFTDQDIAKGRLPAERIIKNSRKVLTLNTTGVKTKGIKAATGSVVLINTSIHQVIVKKGTLLEGNNVQFRTRVDVVVPRKKISLFGEKYGNADVEIIAVKKGRLGNLPAKTITKIAAPLNRVLKVVNLAPTGNGKDIQIKVVTEADYQKAKTEIMSQIQATARQELAQLNKKSYIFFTDLIETTVQKVKHSHPVNSETSSFETTLDYRIQGLIVAIEKAKELLIKQQVANIPENFQLINQDMELVKAEVVSGEKANSIILIGKGRIRGVVNLQKVKKMIKGKSLTKVREILSKHDEIDSFRIKAQGEWSKLPEHDFQIQVYTINKKITKKKKDS